MDSVELISITTVSPTTVEVNLRTNGVQLHTLVMQVQTTSDGSITSVRPPDSLADIIGPDPRVIQPVFDAVPAFQKAQQMSRPSAASARPPGSARYVVGWGRDDTQPTGQGQVPVGSVAELDAVLDEIEATGIVYVVDICPDDDDREGPYGLQIGVGPIERSFAVYIGEPAGGLGCNPDLPEWHSSITFDYGGEPTEYGPDRLRLTAAQVRQLARTYVRTGEQPTTVAWLR
jgi:Immunity protein Imm1